MAKSNPDDAGDETASIKPHASKFLSNFHFLAKYVSFSPPSITSHWKSERNSSNTIAYAAKLGRQRRRRRREEEEASELVHFAIGAGADSTNITAARTHGSPARPRKKLRHLKGTTRRSVGGSEEEKHSRGRGESLLCSLHRAATAPLPSPARSAFTGLHRVLSFRSEGLWASSRGSESYLTLLLLAHSLSDCRGS